MFPATSARKALSGFFLLGMLVAFLGAILPAWGYHRTAEYLIVGNYFLAMMVGILASGRLAAYLLPRKGIRFVLVLAPVLASLSFLFLAAIPPAAAQWWRLAGVFSIGISAGFLNRAVFQAISPLYERDRAATVNLGGAFFGLGCTLTCLLVGGTFYVCNVPSILVLLASVPGFFAATFAKSNFEEHAWPREPSLRQTLADFRSPAAVLLGLLLFLQFGNEWSIAGWLALFLVQRLGVSPEASLLMLSLYWLALMLGRVGVQPLLIRVRHTRLLAASGVSAVLGCTILLATDNLFGAAAGLVFTGGGFAAIYPLVVEKIGDRFPYYHPGFFNGIFSLAMTGGLLAPWTVGIYAQLWGIGAVMLLPMLGSCAVFLLLILIWLYAKLTDPGGGETVLPNRG